MAEIDWGYSSEPDDTNSPLSPFEQQLGRHWTSEDDDRLRSGQNPAGITQSAIDTYTSGGMTWPGPRAVQPIGVTENPRPRAFPLPPLSPNRPPPTTPPPTGRNNPTPSPWSPTFNDAPTRQYEELIQAQLALYQAQLAEMQQAAAAAKARRAATGPAADRLTGYINERVGKLQGPAYTGAEGEVIRTQFLDPLERDRSAAQKRALEQISARGMRPESGIANQLMLDVNRAFDEQRTRGQGTIASRQIEEQRSREQEAQSLLQYLVQLPDAVARGDLDFVNYTQSLISQPGQQSLTVAQLLADLPRERLNDALATLGLAPSMGGNSATLLSLLNNQQSQRYLQNAVTSNAWANVGRSFFPG